MSRLVDISPYEKCRIVLHPEDSGFPVKDLPTVDAVEVVRCRDCRWIANPFCPLYKHPTHSYDDFCSYGERKEASE